MFKTEKTYILVYKKPEGVKDDHFLKLYILSYSVGEFNCIKNNADIKRLR